MTAYSPEMTSFTNAGYEASYPAGASVEDYLTEEALTEFVLKWKLQDEAQQLLGSLPLEMQRKIVMEFSPRDAERDANAIFLKFARGVSQANEGGEEMNEFIKRWSLGAEASQMIAKLNPMMRSRVMQEFSPRDTTSDVNNIFIRFTQGIVNRVPRVGEKGGKGWWKGSGKKGGGKGGGKYSAPQYSAAPAYHQPQAFGYQGEMSVPQFIARWGLDAQANSYMESMPPMVQQKIMQEFSPRDVSRDANAIFMRFASSVAQSQGFSGGNAFGGNAGYAPQASYAPQVVTPPRQQHQQQQAPVQTNPNDAQGFLDRWRLGPEAQQIFYGLLPVQQQKVMADFMPRDPSSDCNNIFSRFCQGIARGTPQKGAGKGGFQQTYAGDAAFQQGGLAPRFSPY